jgi:hypothetical protein
VRQGQDGRGIHRSRVRVEGITRRKQYLPTSRCRCRLAVGADVDASKAVGADADVDADQL